MGPGREPFGQMDALCVRQLPTGEPTPVVFEERVIGADGNLGRRLQLVQGVASRLQVGPAVADIRLQVTALAPLVPGVDENQPLVARELLAGFRQGVFEPLAIALGRGVDEQPRTPLRRRALLSQLGTRQRKRL